MWSIIRRFKRVSSSQNRNRISVKPRVDRLEGRALLTFSPITYSIFPNATVMVAGRQYSNGQEFTKTKLLPASMDGFANTVSPTHPTGTSASAYARMVATARDQGKVESGTVTISNDDLKVKIEKSTAASSRAQTNFTYTFSSTTPFIFRDSGYLDWTWGVTRTTPGSVGSIAIYQGSRRLAGSDLPVYAGTRSPFSAMSNTLPAGQYTIKLTCANDTNITNSSTLKGVVDWSLTAV